MHKKLEELVESGKQKETDWIKVCLTLISTMFGIIVAFSKNQSEKQIVIYSYSVTIVLFGLCILCGLVFLYRDTNIRDQMIRDYMRQTHNLSQPLMSQVYVTEPKVFSYARKLFFVLLFLLILSLCTYAIIYKLN